MLKKVASQIMRWFGVPDPPSPELISYQPPPYQTAGQHDDPVPARHRRRVFRRRGKKAGRQSPASGPAPNGPRQPDPPPDHAVEPARPRHRAPALLPSKPGSLDPAPVHRPAPPVDAADPPAMQPPTFGRAPRAALVPWRLPVEPSTSGIAADQAELGGLCVRAASIVGSGHRCEDPAVARQDSYRLGRDDSGRHLIIAVADGMSDSRRSDLGAMVAVRCAVDTVRYALNRGAQPDQELVHNTFRRSAGAMVSAARDSKLSEDDVRCALILAIVPAWPDDDSGRRTAWFGWLADVSAWGRDETTWRQLAGDQKAAGMDRNALRQFLPHHPDQVRTIVNHLPAGATITVVTDGVGDAFTEVPGADGWFAQRWRNPMPLESYLLDIGYRASGQLDDRTAVTVWCSPAERR